MSSLSISTYAQPFGALTAVAVWPADDLRRFRDLLHWLLIAGIVVTTLAPAMPVVVIPSVDFASYEMPSATTPAAAAPPAQSAALPAGAPVAALPIVRTAPVQFVPAFIPQPGYELPDLALTEISAPVVTYEGSATTSGENVQPRFFDPAAIWAPTAAAESAAAADPAWWQAPQAAILDAGDPLWGAADAPAMAVAENASAWWQDPQAAILDASDPLWGDVAAAPEIVAAAEPATAWWQDPQAAILDASDPLWGDVAAAPETIAAAEPSTAWWQDPQAFTLQLDGAQAVAAAGTPGSFSGPSQESAPATLPAFGVCTSPITLTMESLTPLIVTQGDTLSAYTVTVVLANSSDLTPTGPVTYTIALPANFFFVGSSAAAVRNSAGALNLSQPTVNSAAGATVTLVLQSTPVSETLPAGGVITLTYRVGAGLGGTPDPILSQTVDTGEPAISSCSVAQTVNTNYCPLAGQLALVITPPPFLVSYGNSSGDLYTITLRNVASYTMTGVSFDVDPIPGFFFIGGSASGAHSLGASVDITQPAANTAAGDSFVLRVATPFPLNAVGPNETITVVMRLGTTSSPKSGQPLIVTARSGVEGADLTCSTTRENIATGRGHLYVRKSVSPLMAAVGDLVTFTILIDNTGLGSIYNTAFTDTLGSGLSAITPLVAVASEIKPNGVFTYSVSAVISSCVGTNNIVSVWWPVGNINNTATEANPSVAGASVRVSNPLPNVSIQAKLPEITFCRPPQFTEMVPVTITNNESGPAALFALSPAQVGNAANITFSTDTPN